MHYEKNGFSLVFPKREGGMIFPPDYLCLNGSYPKKSIYSERDLKEHKEYGITDDWYEEE